jgi:hypothetical protein
VIATPAPAAPPTAVAPTPQASAAPAAAPPAAAPRHSLLWIALFIALLLLPALGVVLWFLRRSATGAPVGEAAWDEDDDDWVAADEPAPPPTPAPIVPPRRPPGTSARPQLEIAFTPRRAGANITSAAVEYDLEVRNTGAIAAEDVRVRVDLVTAGNDHDAQLEAPFAQPVDAPMTAPFTLPANDKIGLRAMVMLPKSAISVVTVKGRPMFVPIVAVDVRYRWASGEGQTAESFVIGIAAKQGERMRPFWLDVTPRMYDTATARPHAVGARR